MRPGHIPRVEACDPSPAGGGEVEEDCTMASPVHVCRAVCEGVSLLGGRLFYNMPITPYYCSTVSKPYQSRVSSAPLARASHPVLGWV